MNKAIMSGEVTILKDEEYNGNKYVSFTIENKEPYKDKASGKMKSWSTRMKCVYHNPNFTMGIGDFIYVEGKITVRSYEGANGKMYVTEIKCDDVQVVKTVDQEKTYGFGPPRLNSNELPPF